MSTTLQDPADPRAWVRLLRDRTLAAVVSTLVIVGKRDGGMVEDDPGHASAWMTETESLACGCALCEERKAGEWMELSRLYR